MDVPPATFDQLSTNLIMLVPQERIVFIDSGLDMKRPEELFLAMSNVETLSLSGGESSEGFLQPTPEGPHANTKLLPSLQLLRLKDIIFLSDEHWGYLTTFLAHHTSDGQSISLEVVGNLPYMGPGVMDEIMGLVKEFTHHENPEEKDEEDEG